MWYCLRPDQCLPGLYKCRCWECWQKVNPKLGYRAELRTCAKTTTRRDIKQLCNNSSKVQSAHARAKSTSLYPASAPARYTPHTAATCKGAHTRTEDLAQLFRQGKLPVHGPNIGMWWTACCRIPTPCCCYLFLLPQVLLQTTPVQSQHNWIC